MKNKKLLVTGAGLNLLRDAGAYPCAVCSNEVGVNSIECTQCELEVHKKCSGIMGRITNITDYVCSRCLDQVRSIDGRPVTQVVVDGSQLDVEASFCYLGDTLCAGGG